MKSTQLFGNTVFFLFKIFKKVDKCFLKPTGRMFFQREACGEQLWLVPSCLKNETRAF